jgi:hypothetical protein
MFCHCGWPFSHAGVAVAAEIGHDQAIRSRQKFGHRKPELSADREGVQQDDRRAAACDVKIDFRVTAGDAFHAEIIGKATGS